MKIKVLISCFLSFFLLANTVVVSEVVAAWLPPANTDVCWGNANAIVRIRFVTSGGGYYQLVGKITGSEGIRAILGSAVTANNVFYITTTTTGSTSADTWMETARVVLNRTTLALTIETMGVSHDKTNPDPENAKAWYDATVTMPHITCP